MYIANDFVTKRDPTDNYTLERCRSSVKAKRPHKGLQRPIKNKSLYLIQGVAQSKLGV